MTDRFVIDCDQKPSCGHNWVVLKHEKGGSWEWNPNIKLFVSERQKTKDGIYLGDLSEELKELKDYKVINANVLNFLLKRKYLIPETCKGPTILFWGTFFGFGDDLQCVRGMHWGGSDWIEDYLFLCRKMRLGDDYRIALADNPN